VTDPPRVARIKRNVRGRGGVGRSALLFSGVVTLLFAGPLFTPMGTGLSSPLSAQEAEVYWGAALGGYSGTTLGLLGSAGICNKYVSTEACPRLGSILGGVVGAIGGGVLGDHDQDALRGRLRGAGYGGLIGAAAGYGLMLGIRQFGWADASTFLALGAGVGASPVGSGIGWGAGALVGTIAWRVIPKVKVGDIAAFSMLGLSVGGLIGWALEWDGSSPQEEPTLIIPFQIRF
jgi:hypothetical protein